MFFNVVSYLNTDETSTINHSSSVHELVKAIQTVGPDLIIFDTVVEQKLHEACKLLKENGRRVPSRMMSLVSRAKDIPLVTYSIFLNFFCYNDRLTHVLFSVVPG